MSWQKVEVNEFKGLNSTTSPELIADGEARDILNFRMEKVGKLVSRDGYKIGLFAHHDFNKTAGTVDTAHVPNTRYINNLGIIGIGELVLAERWDLLDTDRFMVYAIRSGETDDEGVLNTSRKNNFECILLSPNNGTHANKIFTNDNIFANRAPSPLTNPLDHKRDVLAQGVTHTVDLFAPDALELPRISMQNGRDIFGGFCRAIDIGTQNPRNFYRISQAGTFNGVDYIVGDIVAFEMNPNTGMSIPVRIAKGDAENWIDDFIMMNQYRHKLVISDKTNGDMLLSDRYDKQIKTEQNNRIHLGPNQLDAFDIDIVHVDYRLGTEEENEKVETGMALYKYVLPEKTYKITEDFNADRLANPNYFPESKNDKIDNRGFLCIQRAWDILFGEGSNYPTFMSIGHFYTGSDDHWEYRGVSSTIRPNIDGGHIDVNTSGDYIYKANINTTNNYTFSNRKEPVKFKSLLDPIELDKDEYFDKNGKKITDRSSNVYTWEDYKIPYYPCSGINYDNNFFLKEIDRLFAKTTDGIPKVTKLLLHDSYGRQVPLGIWQYRFVFEYDDGVYGAPSEEFVVNDILWSAIRDTDNVGVYRRPNQPISPKWLADILPNNANWGVNGFIDHPPVLDSSYNITTFGKSLRDLKSKMYAGTDNKYADLPTNDATFNALTPFEKTGLGVSATVWYSDDMVEFDGTFYESGMFVWQSPKHSSAWTNPWYDRIIMSGEDKVDLHQGRLVLPIFPGVKGLRYNSFSDEDGNVRLSLSPNSISSRQFILPDYSSILDDRMGRYTYAFAGFAITNITALTETSIFLSISCLDADANNQPHYTHALGAGVRDVRVQTPVKAVKRGEDRLAYIYNSDIPTEALDRLLVQGTAEHQITKHGDVIQWQRDKSADLGFSFASPKFLTEVPTDEIELHTKPRGGDKFITMGTPYDLVAGTVQYAPNVTNVEIYLYGDGERFIGGEQLTSYFPSSLLFRAPRVRLKINVADIPVRAKKIKIFRTRASHDNAYIPTDFGLVEEIELKRNNDGTLQDFVYFDKVKDDALDFSDQARDYEGIRTALMSRFNISLLERTYFLNFVERYRPIEPNISEIKSMDFPKPNATTGFLLGDVIKYKILYEDNRKIQSVAIDYSHTVTNATGLSAIVLYNIPMPYDGDIEKVKVYRSTNNQDYYLLYEYKKDDENGYPESIVTDAGDYIEVKPLYIDKGVDAENYESGLRWSEPYRPDWIKFDSFMEYRSGDGDQATGLGVLYGNLVIFKENSIHRSAVQGNAIPISRTDEVTPNIGCIAPMTLINLNNTLFFLSWKGFMSYDNNSLRKIDGPFDEELQFAIRECGDSIRYASCGYNPAYNEIYLCLPNFRHEPETDDTWMTNLNAATEYTYTREQFGHIYVINIDKQYITKFGYQPTDLTSPVIDNVRRIVTAPEQMCRIYYKDSLGNMRSADVLPATHSLVIQETNRPWAGIYIETPIERDQNDSLFQDCDEHPRGDSFSNDVFNRAFPQIKLYSVKSKFKSKLFGANTETVLKRIRDGRFNIYSQQPITIETVSYPYDDTSFIKNKRRPNVTIQTVPQTVVGMPEFDDSRINENLFPPVVRTFLFGPTDRWAARVWQYTNTTTVNSINDLAIATWSPTANGVAMQTTRSNILTTIETTPYIQNPDWADTEFWDDAVVKTVLRGTNIYTECRTQINSVGFYWRPIYTYLR